jgi:hypothetical protein
MLQIYLDLRKSILSRIHRDGPKYPGAAKSASNASPLENRRKEHLKGRFCHLISPMRELLLRLSPPAPAPLLPRRKCGGRRRS